MTDSPVFQRKAENTLLYDYLDNWAKQYPDRPVCYEKVAGEYEPWSYRRLEMATKGFGIALLQMGVVKGDRVAIWSRNCPEWVVADLAILRCGAIGVPIYPTVSADAAGYILKHAGVKVLICYAWDEQVAAIHSEFPDIRIISIEENENTSQLMALAHNYEGSIEDEKMADWPDADPNDIASIVYTSGTTGNPKGVMLSHKNFMSNVTDILSILPLSPADSVLSFLPLSHVFERTAGYYAPLAAGISIYYADSHLTVATDIVLAKPSILIAVPRFFEKIHQRIMTQLKGVKGLLFQWAHRIGSDYYIEQKQGLVQRLLLKVAHGLVLKKIHAKTGGNIRFFVSGGAALNPDIWRFFEGMGLPIIEGYGMTESSPVIAATPLDARIGGSVGVPLPSVQIRVADDGELLAKGPNIMQGYWDNESASSEVIDEDGFLKTGDIVKIDDDGYIFIVDRKKELIVLSNGKNVAPVEVENLLKASPEIEEAVVIGNGHSYITALIWPEDPGNTDKNHFTKLVNQRLSHLSSFKKVKKFSLMLEPLPEDFVTATLKIKRKALIKHYQDRVDAMYSAKA